MTKPPTPMSMPSIALAKTGAKEGTEEWYRAIAQAHGNTDDHKNIELRRNRLTGLIIMLNKGIEDIHNARKLLPINLAKQIEAFQVMRAGLMEKADAAAHPALEAETVLRIEEMKAAAAAQDMAYNMAIMNFTGAAAQIEAAALQVDCMTMRLPGRSKKTGKRGLYRYTLCGYVHDLGLTLDELVPIMFKALNIQLPPDGEEELTEEEEVDDDELATDEEIARAKKGGDAGAKP